VTCGGFVVGPAIGGFALAAAWVLWLEEAIPVEHRHTANAVA
jgi:hypothetical protein